MVQHWPSPFPRCGLLSLHLFDRYSIFECRKYSRTSSVDSINMDITASYTVWLLAGSLILGCTSFWFSSLSLFELSLDGAARIDVTLSGELLNAIFANIGLRAIRKVARERHWSTSSIWIWNSIWRGKLDVWREPLVVERFLWLLTNWD